MSFRHLRNVRGFFSDYYLGSIFGRSGRGRAKAFTDREVDAGYRRFRRIHDQAEARVEDAPSCRERFIRPLLRDVLGWHLGDGSERLHVLHASADAAESGATPLAVVYCGGWDEDLDAGHGNAVPGRRVEQAIARLNLNHGFLVSGERCRLVRQPGMGPRDAYIEVDLSGLTDAEDPDSFAAFLRLFHVSQFMPGDAVPPAIDRVEKESREHAERVSDDLKRAVFTAAEILIGGLLQDSRDRDRCVDPTTLSEADLLRYRDAALLGLYRILFILYAEARDPRLQEHRLYRQAYSIEGLVEELQHDPSRDWPENRCSLWARLDATFRIYDRGMPAITPWDNIPPRGGDFFSSTTPEGRILAEARLSDRTIARLLLDLTTTAPHRGIGRERVSFRELDIENLGSVYEGLLEFEPRIARETTIEAGVQGRLFALSATDLLRLCESKQLEVRGDFEIVAGTVAEALHPDAPSDEDLDEEESEDEEEEEEADEGEEEADLAKAVKKGAPAKLIRRLESGAFHFVPGPSRKGSGSFYTPRPLVHDLVRHALGPLVEGRSAVEIESLRVVDPACGSAHFLVEAMRFLGRHLHRAYIEEYGGNPPPHFRSTAGLGWDADWRASDEDARASNSEARAWCKRRLAERCLFGVDQNPTAVTLAQVALWIESLAGDRPLTYFRHHVRKGNSLLGTWRVRLHLPSLPKKGAKVEEQGDLYTDLVARALTEAAAMRRLIDRAADDGAVEADSIPELELKERQRLVAKRRLEAVHLLFDLRAASVFVPEIWADWSTLCSQISDPERLLATAEACKWWDEFDALRQRERFFHWELEFPEVFLDSEHPGFDAVVGNPPWDKVLPTKHEFYSRHDVLIRAYKGDDLDRRIHEIHRVRPDLQAAFGAYQKRTKTVAEFLRKGGDFPLSEAHSGAAHEDVSKYFLDRSIRIAADGGRVGMLAPSVVYNGDGCVGIRRFLLTEAAIERFYGFENRKKIFPIDSRYKFVSLVVRKGSAADGFDAAFMRHDLEELEDDGVRPWMVHLTRSEIEWLSPETLALLEYRSPRDQEIVHKMHRGRPTLGGDGPGSWGVTFVSWRQHNGIYNVKEDKDLWTDPKTGQLYTPARILGTVPSDSGEVIHQMRERGFWPVFEGKHIDQFLVGIKPVRWWLSVEQAVQKYGKAPRNEPTLVFRETASNTNERTCIAAVLPEGSVASHKLSGVQPEHLDAESAATVLNSLCFDYALRLRTAGTNVSFTYMRPMPVPKGLVAQGSPRVKTQLGWRAGIFHITEDNDLWPVLWAANRAVAEAYDLNPIDFEHIVASFPGLARKRKAFFAYLRERLAEWEQRDDAHTRLTTSYVESQLEERIANVAEAAELLARRPSRKHAG